MLNAKDKIQCRNIKIEFTPYYSITDYLTYESHELHSIYQFNS